MSKGFAMLTEDRPVVAAPVAPPARRRRRWIWLGGAAFALLALFYLGGGWFFSSQIFDGAFDPEPGPPDYSLRVTATDGVSVTITAGIDAPSALLEPGVWGVGNDSGFGQVGPIEESHLPGTVDGWVRRTYTHLWGRAPAPGDMVELINRAYPADPMVSHGYAFADVAIAGELGALPAWLVTGHDDTWVVFVHGNGLTRLDGMRALPAVVDLGMPALLITYRNDPGTVPDPTGRFQYGQTEWRDIEAAVRFAIDEGAADVVLFGHSMGGAIVSAFLEESTLAGNVAGVILDAPALDLGRAVDVEAGRRTLPGLPIGVPDSLTGVAKLFTAWRWDVDWARLDYVGRAETLEVPVLVFHGAADETVPVSISRELAAARPDLVTYVETASAGHGDSWNHDPAAYRAALAEFLAPFSG